MKAVNNIILSVDEKAAYRRDSGLYITAEAGSAFDHITQSGTIVAAPHESGLDIGDVVYFKHMAKDDLVGKKEKDVAKFNWDLEEVPNITYTIAKEAANLEPISVSYNLYSYQTKDESFRF